MKQYALGFSGSIFLLMAIVHVVRYEKGWSIIIDGFSVPLTWSIYGAVVAAIISLWMFTAARRR